MEGQRVRVQHSAIVLACLSNFFTIPSPAIAGDLKPYPLPREARSRIEKLAETSDILILGELHGTQEVPELVASVLPSLTELGYRTLALEVPNEDQAALSAWARGETDRIPDFFAKPSGDGRGNAQLMALTRIAVSPRFRWRIICFDASESNLEKQRLARTGKKPTGKAEESQLVADDAISDWRERDAAMESNLLSEIKSLERSGKTIAICGNLHARIRNDVPDPMLSKLWPSFAAVLKQRQPAWRVSSVNIEFSSGAFFNDGKVQAIRGRPVDHAVVRSTGEGAWNLVLSLPKASPATFARSNQ
jgi:hypothetical protein